MSLCKQPKWIPLSREWHCSGEAVLMSLRKPPKSTPRRSAASRENGKKSHSAPGQSGCRSERRLSVDSRLRGNDTLRQGRANVSLNALRHGSYSSASARTFGDTLMALGEASEEFERLYQELLAPDEPAVAGEDTRATGTYDLGEAPEEFDRLYQQLLAPYEPAHPLGRTISSNFKFKEQTWNVIENKGQEKWEPGMFMKIN